MTENEFNNICEKLKNKKIVITGYSQGIYNEYHAYDYPILHGIYKQMLGIISSYIEYDEDRFIKTNERGIINGLCDFIVDFDLYLKRLQKEYEEINIMENLILSIFFEINEATDGRISYDRCFDCYNEIMQYHDRLCDGVK